MRLCLVAKLEDLPERDEKDECRIDRERRVQERHIGAMARRIIAQTVIHEHQSRQQPQQTHECKDVEVEKLYSQNTLETHSSFFLQQQLAQSKAMPLLSTAIKRYQYPRASKKSKMKAHA